MAPFRPPGNRVQAQRRKRGWTQADLSRRAGVSRAAVSAIEINRLVPSVAAALALAAAFGCMVEDLFGPTAPEGAPAWAWPPVSDPGRYWHAQVGGRTLHYPAEATSAGVVGHDGLHQGDSFRPGGDAAAAETLVLVCCDPASALLASALAGCGGFRLLSLTRSSRQALALLGRGLIHAAGVHLAAGDKQDGNAAVVREMLGGGYRLLRVARWEEGLTVAPGTRLRSVRSALRAGLRWVGREPGSAARQCLDELLAGRAAPRRLARDHRGVAEAVRCGWADVGVCLRLACEEAGLRFLPVRYEWYDLCYPAAAEDDPRLRALRSAVRSPEYRRVLGELPGFDTAQAGEVRDVD